jgi:hypothetical protein
VKSYLQSLDLECWLHRGRLGRTPWAVCLYQPRAEACEPLLRALDELQENGPPVQRVLTFQRCQRPGSFSAMRLKLVAESSELRVLCISHDAPSVTITMTADGWDVLRDAVEAWRKGSDDFGISPLHGKIGKRELGAADRASGELWFWGPFYWGP